MKETSQKATDILENALQEKNEELERINEKLKQEIAELRQTEKILRENETRFNRAQEMGKVGSWEWDLIQNKTKWSNNLYHIFGVKPEQFDPDAYEAFLNCIFTEDRQFVKESIDKSIADKTGFNIEYRIIRPDGTVRDIHALGEIICDETGKPFKVIGASQDITERKQAETRLKRSESIGKIGNWEYDIDKNRISWSDEVYELFERDPKSGPPTTEEEEKYYSVEDRNRLNKYVQQVIDSGNPVTDYEFPVKLKNDKIRYFMGSMFPGKDKKGRIVKLFGIFQDITNRKQAQLEIVRHLEFEKYISELASHLITLSANKINEEITKTLSWMANYFGVDRVTLLKYSVDKNELKTINLFRTDKIKPVLTINLDTLLPSILTTLKIGNPVSWSTTNGYNEITSPGFKKLDQLGAKSVVIIPVMVGEHLKYVFTIASLNDVQTWDKHLIPRIQLLGTLITSVLERKDEREKLKQNERSLADAQRLAHVGDWQTDLSNNEVLWSDELYNILGYEQSKIKASRMAFLDRVHPDDRPLLEESISSLRIDNHSFAIDHRIVLADGKIKYCHSMGKMRFDDENKPIFLHGIMQDITERKLTEDALRKSENNLSAAQRIAHLGSWERNILTDEVTWSDELYRIFGLDKQSFKVTFDSFLEFVHPEDRPLLKQAVGLALINSESIINLQFRIIRFDGIEKIVHGRGEVILDENDNPIFIIGTLHDITELKNIEAETKQLRNQLTHLSRVNTIGNMATAIAHEINQPLAAILSNSQAALRLMNVDPPDLGEVREALKDIVDADKRAGEVIRRIRTLVKKEEIPNEPYHINKAINEVIDLVQNETLIHNTSITTKLDPLIPELYGDHIQLQQVILNLIMNSLEAVKSQPINSRHIDIATSKKDNQSISVSISDSGPGVDKANIENIFDPFYTTKAKGMGMGLSVCHSIIENHGGRIFVENGANGGAEFTFQLPLRKDENK